MRNLQCTITDMRKKVFAEVAKLAYEGGDYYTRLEKLPYELMPGEVGTVRESIFLERAIVGERIRLAMGLPLRDVSEHTLLSDGVEESAIAAARKAVEDCAQFQEILITRAGCTISSHCGPGTLGILFIRK